MRADSKTYATLFRAAARAEELDDFNHAISGVDVGRMRKHIQGEGIDPITGRKRNKASDGIRRTLEWLLLNYQSYARLYEKANTAVSEVAQAAEQTLEQALTKLEEAQDRIAEALTKSAKLPGERSVFRDENGVVKDASGNVIAADIAAGIQWVGDEPSYEDYRALVDGAKALEVTANELRGIETEIGGYQGELADNEAPPSQERLEAITERSGDLRERLDDIQADLDNTADVKVSFGSQTIGNQLVDQDFDSVPTIKIGG